MSWPRPSTDHGRGRGIPKKWSQATGSESIHPWLLTTFFPGVCPYASLSFRRKWSRTTSHRQEIVLFVTTYFGRRSLRLRSPTQAGPVNPAVVAHPG